MTSYLGEVEKERGEVSRRVKDAVRHAWIDVLQQHHFDPHQHWYETSGDSLKKLNLWLQVENALGVRVPYQPFGDYATPDEIAAIVERVLIDRQSLIIP